MTVEKTSVFPAPRDAVFQRLLKENETAAGSGK